MYAFLSSADFLFSKSTFSKYSFRNTMRVSNSLDPDQDRHSVGPELGPNRLQILVLIRVQTVCKCYQQTTLVGS